MNGCPFWQRRSKHQSLGRQQGQGCLPLSSPPVSVILFWLVQSEGIYPRISWGPGEICTKSGVHLFFLQVVQNCKKQVSAWGGKASGQRYSGVGISLFLTTMQKEKKKQTARLISVGCFVPAGLLYVLLKGKASTYFARVTCLWGRAPCCSVCFQQSFTS